MYNEAETGMENNYDIFLSYRRDGGFETAKHLYDLLTRDGYRVSFDIDTLRSGDFDTGLLQRIDCCTDFIIILDKDVFSRTLDITFNRNRDWLRIELAYALEHGKNIIPVMLSGFMGFPDNLPADIAEICRKNGPKYDKYYFDAFYDRLTEFLYSQPKMAGSNDVNGEDISSLVGSVLKIETDTPCRIFVDGSERCIAKPSETTRLALRGGSYRLRFESIENPADNLEDRTFKIDKDVEEWYTVALLPVRQKRENLEKIRSEQRMPKEKKKSETQCGRYSQFTYLQEKVFDKQLVSFEDNGKWGLRDKETGNEIVPCRYDIIGRISDGTAKVRQGRKWGFIGRTGKEITPCIYDYARDFSNLRAAVRKGSKWGFIDKEGKEIVHFIYDYADDFYGNMAKVKKDGKFGAIGENGNEVVPCIYDEIDKFSSGLTRVKRNGKYGFIDKTGKEITQCIYDEARPFTGISHTTMVRKKNVFGQFGPWITIGANGKIILTDNSRKQGRQV